MSAATAVLGPPDNTTAACGFERERAVLDHIKRAPHIGFIDPIEIGIADAREWPERDRRSGSRDDSLESCALLRCEFKEGVH